MRPSTKMCLSMMQLKGSCVRKSRSFDPEKYTARQVMMAMVPITWQ